MGQTGVIYFINTSSEINHVLYSFGIDLHLDPQHHFPPGSWLWWWRAPGGPNNTFSISRWDEHVFMIYKALNNAETSSLQLHTKFQKSVRPSWRVDTSFSSFLHSWAHPAMVGVQMVVMLLLLAINMKPCSVTSLIVPITTSYDDVTSYRTRIDDGGEKPQHNHLLDPAWPHGPKGAKWWEWRIYLPRWSNWLLKLGMSL